MKLSSLISFFIAFLHTRFNCAKCKLLRLMKRRLCTWLPNIIKKQTLFVTLYLKGRNEKIFEDVNMTELNRHLTIANDSVALDYIVTFNEKCDWYHFTFDQLLTKHNCSLDTRVDGDVITQISMDIIEKMPKWLMYGDQRSMVNDLSNFLTKVPISKLQSCPAV